MTFLPIVQYELRVRARRTTTYVLRTSGAALVIAVTVLMLVVSSSALSPAQVGASVFWMLAWGTFLFCLFDGVRSTADSLSREKREGTLGLLFLTDLHGYDVAVGKLAATSLESLYVLLAVFPPLALPLVVGGVSGGEFWRLVAVLLDTLLLSLTVSLAVSASTDRGERALLGAAGLLTGLALLPLLARWAPRLYWLAWLSPSTAMLHVPEGAFRADSRSFYAGLVSVHLLSWLAVSWAGWRLPRDLHEPGAVQSRLWRYRLEACLPLPLRRAVHAALSRYQNRLRRRDPLVWLFLPSQEWHVWMWLIVVLLGVTLIGCEIAWSGSGVGSSIMFLVILQAVFVVCATLAASYSVHRFRDSGLAGILATTPAGGARYAAAQFRALTITFLPPLGAFVAVALLAYGYEVFLQPASRWTQGELAFQTLLLLAYALMVHLDVLTCLRFGQYMALVSRSTGMAIFKTLLVVEALPLLLAPCCAFVLFPVVGLVKDMVLLAHANASVTRWHALAWHDERPVRRRGWAGTRVPPRLPPVLPSGEGPPPAPRPP